jgi:hypothetical protein
MTEGEVDLYDKLMKWHLTPCRLPDDPGSVEHRLSVSHGSPRSFKS